MNSREKALAIAGRSNGIITASDAVSEGISGGSIKHLSDSGQIVRVSRGVYVAPGAVDDEFVNLQSRYRKGIFCGETALFLYDLTDRTPDRYFMTFPASYNVSGIKREGSITCYRIAEPRYSSGINEAKTPGGNTVKAYCIERTLCDILIPRRHVDIQVISDAFKRYVGSGNCDLPHLTEYAKLLKVEKRLSAYMEVLI